jgi:hypothetical protein
MGDQSFLVTLPSNSNMKAHPENEPGSYTVKLASPIKLDGEWEVALVSVQYTHCWSNLAEDILLRFFVIEDRKTNPDKNNDFLEYPLRTPAADFDMGHILYARLAARHNRNNSIFRKLPSNMQIKHVNMFSQYFSNPQSVGNEISRLFKETFPDSPVKLQYNYNHFKRKGSFVTQNGIVLIMTNDNRLSKLIGHADTWVLCDDPEHGGTVGQSLFSRRPRQADAQIPVEDSNTQGSTDTAVENTSPSNASVAPEVSDALHTAAQNRRANREQTRKRRISGDSLGNAEVSNASGSGESNTPAVPEVDDSVQQSSNDDAVTFRSYFITDNVDYSAHWHLLHFFSSQKPELPRISSLWVYSDISQYQFVGDTQVPLLGIVPVDSEIGQRRHHSVNPVHFVGLRRNEISEIKIQVCTDKGERVPFASGDDDDNLVCCLRFRPRKSTLPI